MIHKYKKYFAWYWHHFVAFSINPLALIGFLALQFNPLVTIAVISKQLLNYKKFQFNSLAVEIDH